MSKERCQATKQLMKQALGILQSGAAGQGRGVSLAITYLEDSYLRMDFHMREQGWTEDKIPVVPTQLPVNGEQRIVPRTNTLRPAANIPQLNTGLMGPPPTPVTDSQANPPRRKTMDVREDLDLL